MLPQASHGVVGPIFCEFAAISGYISETVYKIASKLLQNVYKKENAIYH